MNLKSTSQKRNDGSALSKADIEELRSSIKGTVVTKDEASQADYDAAVIRWNHVSIRPANIIVFVEDEYDVAECVKFVEKHWLDVAITGGRHSYHGASSSHGLVIDLRRMRRVTIDKGAMTATAQGGCLAGDVEKPCEAEGLMATFGNVNETGIGGLTVGGGVGPLSGLFGLAADNVLAARMVIAGGKIVTASADENSDLYWAIRGGGPNFGVVTEFKYRVHKLGKVFVQMAFFEPEKLKDCVSLANKIHDTCVEEKGNFGVMMVFLTPPGGSSLRPGFRVFYNGPEERAKELAAPIYDLKPTTVSGGMTDFSKTTEVPPYTNFPGFERYAASSATMDYPLDENLIVTVFHKFQSVVQKYQPHTRPSKCILDLRSYAKIASVPVDATAYPGRVECSYMIPDLQWDDAAMDLTMRQEVTGITQYLRGELKERKIKASTQNDGQSDVTVIYPNISAGGEEKAKSVYGSNLPRLEALKKKYDPDFMWNKWFPITPAQ